MKEYRISLFVFVLVAGALMGAVYFFESERERHQQIEETDHEVLDVESSVVEVKGEGELSVKLFFCAAGAKGPSTRAFEIEERTILKTEDPVLNARQIVNEIMKSRGDESPRIFPEEARVRQIYLLDDGTALVDLAQETTQRLAGGVTSELCAIRSITRSLKENLTQIKRVKFLVGGEERATLAGHVSIGRPF